MTCKDCISNNVCALSPIRESYSNANIEDICEHFKNKADFVEVPCRCGDCKNYNNHRYCYYFATTVLDDDFCSYGKRK